MMSYDYPHPVSRTYQYKKITKPLLERKRRARINRCLDELKDLMVDALETEGEDISKLEKADILELTVRHLQRLQASRSSELSETIAKTEDVSAESRWLSGFGHCAAEACRFLSALPGEAAERLARHLAAGLQTNRQTNSSLKSALLTPTLANLDRTANLVAPCPQSPTIDVLPNTRVPSASKITPQKASPYSEINLGKSFTLTSFCVSSDGSSGSIVEDGKLSSSYKAQLQAQIKSSRDRRMSTKMKSNEAEVNEDEEEIDVERVDEGDPMWRPW